MILSFTVSIVKILLSTGKGQYEKGNESYNNPNPNPLLLKETVMNYPRWIKVTKSLSLTAQNKTPSVENMPYKTIDKEDLIISVEKHIYYNKDDSS